MSQVTVLMKTSLGDVKIALDEKQAPISVANFLSYVDDGFYDNTIFHRVIKDFMIQCGGFGAGMKKKDTRAAIRNESPNGLSNVRGSLAMARTSDLNSATSQFYINTVNNASHLDAAQYCVFGQVTEGLDVVDKIRAVRTTTQHGHQDVPVDDVVILSIRRAD